MLKLLGKCCLISALCVLFKLVSRYMEEAYIWDQGKPCLRSSFSGHPTWPLM